MSNEIAEKNKIRQSTIRTFIPSWKQQQYGEEWEKTLSKYMENRRMEHTRNPKQKYKQMSRAEWTKSWGGKKEMGNLHGRTSLETCYSQCLWYQISVVNS